MIEKLYERWKAQQPRKFGECACLKRKNFAVVYDDQMLRYI